MVRLGVGGMCRVYRVVGGWWCVEAHAQRQTHARAAFAFFLLGVWCGCGCLFRQFVLHANPMYGSVLVCVPSSVRCLEIMSLFGLDSLDPRRHRVGPGPGLPFRESSLVCVHVRARAQVLLPGCPRRLIGLLSRPRP